MDINVKKFGYICLLVIALTACGGGDDASTPPDRSEIVITNGSDFYSDSNDINATSDTSVFLEGAFYKDVNLGLGDCGSSNFGVQIDWLNSTNGYTGIARLGWRWPVGWDGNRISENNCYVTWEAYGIPLDLGENSIAFTAVSSWGSIYRTEYAIHLKNPKVEGLELFLWPGGDQVSVFWKELPGATSYNLYYSTSFNEFATRAVVLANVSSGILVPNLDRGVIYYFGVSAFIDGVEGELSNLRSIRTSH